MKYRISTGCCLLLHLTTFVFASPPPKEDLTHVLQPNNIDHLLLGLDTSIQPVPCTLPFPSNDQSQQPSTDGPPPTTLTCQPAEITANVQQNASKQKSMTYSEPKASDELEDVELKATKARYAREWRKRLRTSDKPEDQKRYLKAKTTKAQRDQEKYKKLKESDKPEDQKRLLERKTTKAQKEKEWYKELKESEDQERFLKRKARNIIAARKYRAKKSKEGLAGSSTQKHTQVNLGILIGTSDVHVSSCTKRFEINISNGPAQESQIQYDKECYGSERAEGNADAVCADSSNLGREMETDVGERPLKRKKVNSDSLELSPVTDDPTCVRQPSSACPHPQDDPKQTELYHSKEGSIRPNYTPTGRQQPQDIPQHGQSHDQLRPQYAQKGPKQTQNRPTTGQLRLKEVPKRS